MIQFITNNYVFIKKKILYRYTSLKCTYHGFLKMTVHMVWNIALRE